MQKVSRGHKSCYFNQQPEKPPRLNLYQNSFIRKITSRHLSAAERAQASSVSASRELERRGRSERGAAEKKRDKTAQPHGKKVVNLNQSLTF